MSFERFIENMLSENFKSYVFIGYDYDGQNVVMKRIKTQQELDAMSAAYTREGVHFESNMYNDEDDEVEDFE